MDKPYKNSSSFQGLKQYFDSQGIEWRREDEPAHHTFWRKRENAFLLVGAMRRHYEFKSVKAIHEAYEYTLESIAEEGE